MYFAGTVGRKGIFKASVVFVVRRVKIGHLNIVVEVKEDDSVTEVGDKQKEQFDNIINRKKKPTTMTTIQETTINHLNHMDFLHTFDQILQMQQNLMPHGLIAEQKTILYGTATCLKLTKV